MINRILENLTNKGKFLVILAIVFFTLYALAGTAIMIVTLDMLDKIILSEPVSLKNYWVALAALVIFKGICNVVADMAKHFAGFNIEERIRKSILLRLKQFSLGFFTKERLGEVSTIIHKDVSNMEGVVAHMWSRMISDFLVALILGAGLFIVDWRVGLAMVSFLPVAIWVLISGIKSGKSLQKRSQDDLSDMVSLFVEYVKGIPLLKAFSESSKFQAKVTRSAEQFGESSKQSAKNIALFLGRYSFFLELCFAVLVTVGTYFVFQDSLTVYSYLMFVIVSREFYKPFVGMEAHWMNYLKVTDSYRRIQTVLDAPVVKMPENPQKPESFSITFKDVCFSYEKDEFALKNINCHLKQGSLTALVGPSGSGKTTITNLLLRFWEPQQGIIKIGKKDIRTIDYDDLLSNISIVMQNVMLFADTIYNNIKIGNKKATKEQIVTAARRAMIHDFIMGLPDGYDTMVGENGVGLSGGQKQRISIARAFLKNASIVILDEMTSNVDPVNEAKIQRAISTLAKNRTVLVIAHHLRTIKTADNILVFNNGKITQAGNHDNLLEQKGLYHSLWTAQEQAKQWKVGLNSSVKY
jgi:ATP-binding cassette subfamily B protein